MAVPRASNTRKSVNYLPIIGAVGALTGLAMVLIGWRAQHFVPTEHDPYSYEAMGRSVLHGHGFEGYGSVLNRRGPLYPLFIALFYRIVGEQSLALQIVHCLLLAGICMLVFDLGRRMFNLRTGLIAGLICAFHPSFLRYVPDFHVEIFLTFLTTLMVWCSVRFKERPTPVSGVAFGAAAALAALTKAVVVLYPPVFLAFWLFMRHRQNSNQISNSRSIPWLALACVFVAMGVVILPWTVRNYRSSGRFVLITTGLGDAYLRGLVFSKTEYITLRRPPYTDAENESNAYFRRLCVAQGTVWERNDIESDRILGQEMKARLKSEPGLLVRKFVVGLFTFWYQMTNRVNSLAAGFMALIGWVLALVGWHKIASERKRDGQREGKEVWPLVLPILYLNVLLALLLALGRYSVPVLPCLNILAALGIDALLPVTTAGTD